MTGECFVVGDGHPALGSLAEVARISSRVSPWVWQPGSAGMEAE
jgi:hypothetical protein